jgi:hypothetical protein
MTPELKKKFWAIAEAHRTAISYEVPFSHLLHKGFTLPLLQSFAYEFRVARSLRWCARNGATDSEYAKMKDEAKTKIMPQLVNTLNGFVGYGGDGLADHFQSQMDLISDNRPGNEHVSALWGRGNFPSGLSKFYMAKTGWNWPPFDSLAATALGVRAQNSVSKAIKYYKTLDERNFADISASVSQAINNDPILKPARVIDKFLLLAGLDNWCMPAAYASTQPRSTQIHWVEVAGQMQNARIDDLLAPSIRERIFQ